MENQDTSNKVVSDHVMAALYGGMMSFVDSKLEYCGYSLGYLGLQNSGCAKTVLYISIEGGAEFLSPSAVLGSMEEGNFIKNDKTFCKLILRTPQEVI